MHKRPFCAQKNLLLLSGDHLTSRNDSSGGCSVGGQDYPDGAWVPVGGSRICRCMRGIVRAPCRAERRRIQPTPPPSFAVGLSFGTLSGGNEKKNKTIGQINKSIVEVSFKQPIVMLKNEGTKIGPKEKTVTRRRLTSGKGTAKLFKLFPEVQEPVVRTSNKTGCHVGGKFFEYPTLTQSMSACRCALNVKLYNNVCHVILSCFTPCQNMSFHNVTCQFMSCHCAFVTGILSKKRTYFHPRTRNMRRCTVEGMLWCWRRGVPQCLGCMVGTSFVPAEANFWLSDGTGCSCQCKQKMEERCLRDNVQLDNVIVR